MQIICTTIFSELTKELIIEAIKNNKQFVENQTFFALKYLKIVSWLNPKEHQSWQTFFNHNSLFFHEKISYNYSPIIRLKS